MSGKSINFDDKKINKSTFYKNKKLFNIHDLDVNKILVPESNFQLQFCSSFKRKMCHKDHFYLISQRLDINNN